MMIGWKYFTFSGDVSTLTDDKGKCGFSNLTIMGSFSVSAYIIISVEGFVQTWTSVYNPMNVNYELPARGLLPVLIEEDVGNITIV